MERVDMSGFQIRACASLRDAGDRIYCAFPPVRYISASQKERKTRTPKMMLPYGLTTVLTLGFLAQRLVAFPSPLRRGDTSVSNMLDCRLIDPSEYLQDFLGKL